MFSGTTLSGSTVKSAWTPFLEAGTLVDSRCLDFSPANATS
ncbi:MAG: hypothetical protein R2734_20125 [Nocardioides sp.]